MMTPLSIKMILSEISFAKAISCVTLITKDGIRELPLMGKDEVAGCLLDEITARR